MKTLALLLSFVCQLTFAKTYPIIEFGAVPDGKTINTRAINDAVRACHAAGGGTVLVPAGTFVTGTVRLLSYVNLHLEPGAVLKGSANLADYQLDGVKHGLIYAFEADAVSITGPGTLDGNSDAFFYPKRMHFGKMGLGFERSYTRQGERYMPEGGTFADGPIYYDARPGMLCVLLRCERVRIRDASFLKSPEWTFRIGDCDDVVIDGITVKTDLAVPNADGIHTTTSRNVRIANCFVSSGDDSIVVTGFGDEINEDSRRDDTSFDYAKRRMGNRTGLAENVVVSNCVLQSRSAGIRIGYGNNSIRNCLFQNIVIFGSNRGIGVFARDRATIDNIRFQHITIDTRLHDGHWWGKGEPIHVSLTPQAENVAVGRVRNIEFCDVTARSESGIVVWGEANNRLQDIRFRNVELTVSGGPLSNDWGGNFDLRPALRNDRKLFRHDIPGLYATQIDGLRLQDVTVRWGQNLPNYMTHGVEIDNATDVQVVNYKGKGASSVHKSLKISDVKFAAHQ